MVLGIALSLLAAICFGISISIQKYSLSHIRKFSLTNMIKNKKWLLASIIGIFGVLFYLVALSLEALSTVQPITSGSLAIPIVIGMFFFKEKLEVKKWLFLALVILGISLVSVF